MRNIKVRLFRTNHNDVDDVDNNDDLSVGVNEALAKGVILHQTIRSVL